VVRAPSAVDRREVVITMSATGSALVEHVMQARRRELDAVLQRMTDDQRTAVVTGLDVFARAASDRGPAITPELLATPMQSASPVLEDG
jgi:hypothetical protein